MPIAQNRHLLPPALHARGTAAPDDEVSTPDVVWLPQTNMPVHQDATQHFVPAPNGLRNGTIGDRVDPPPSATEVIDLDTKRAGSVTPEAAIAAAGAPTVKPFADIATLSDYLVNGYWAWDGTGSHHWTHSTISVNISSLTTSEQTIATQALAVWHDVAGVNFAYTNGIADITYNHNGLETAGTTPQISGNSIISEVVDISSDWAGGSGGGIDSYFFQTYVHETGHALGLGHSGAYNGGQVNQYYNTPSTLYSNDTWQWTVMSYNDQAQYGGATADTVITPATADIFAIQQLYGAQITRPENTIYGFHSTAGSFYDFSSYPQAPAFTIYDTGGLDDQLDASGYAPDQIIDLTPGNWSSIGGNTNNIGIYLGSIIEDAQGGSGNDRIVGNSADNILKGNDGADTMYGGLGNDYLDGGAGNDYLSGGDGRDTLKGGGGADVMVGGSGDDGYEVDSIGDRLLEDANGGTDTVNTTLNSYALPANVENLTFDGTGDFTGVGNGLANIITGGIGADTLKGGGGADTLVGGKGDDTYYLDNSSEVVSEGLGGGTDTVVTSLTNYRLGANVENLTYHGQGNFTATGNSLTNKITGGSGSDTLKGGGGADTLQGGVGDDTYIVTNAGVTVTEAPAAGTDTIETSLSSYALGSNLEHLSYIGSGNFTGAGNSIANTITGGKGDDTLKGGGGADTLIGGAGNDSYYVDDPGDIVTESAGAGADTVYSSLATYVLGADIENLTYTGIGNGGFSGTGNGLADVITGGNKNDLLNGGAGADTLVGGLGNDIYIVDNVSDTVTENPGAGTDTVDTTLLRYTLGANVESLKFIGSGAFIGNGNALDNVLTGGTGNDRLNGGAGNDTLRGGAGKDVLTGGVGRDAFMFDTLPNAVTNVDLITDFNVADDRILLSQLVFAGLGATGALPSNEFSSGAGKSGVGGRIEYNTTTGGLSYDPDGTGAAAATHFATLSPGLGLAASNIYVV